MRKIASLSLDLDNKWSYLKTHGNPAWESYPSYFDVVVPRILEFLAERGLKITFFIVGQDAALAKNRTALRAIADAGHDIGNHSFQHEPWLHLYSEQALDAELALAEEHIERATGKKPHGFRGPGFSLSEATLSVLVKRGYAYDATVFPNLLNPLARAYFFATSNLSAEEKEQRKELFGTWKDALRPVKPFRWELDQGGLLELPVTTMPLFKIPIHLSYVLYLSSYSKTLARLYIRIALLLCRLTSTEPSILLHPLDFLGGDDDMDDLGFFPGMNMDSAVKIDLVDEVLGLLARQYDVVTLAEHAERVASTASLPSVEPQFSSAAG